MADGANKGNNRAPWWARIIGWTFVILLAFNPGVVVSLGATLLARWSSEAEARSTTHETAADTRDTANSTVVASGLLPCIGDPADATTTTTGCDVWVREDGSVLLTVQGQLRIAAGATGGSTAVIQPAAAKTSGSWFQVTPWRIAAVFLTGWAVYRIRRFRQRGSPGGGVIPAEPVYILPDGRKVAYPTAEAAGSPEWPTAT